MNISTMLQEMAASEYSREVSRRSSVQIEQLGSAAQELEPK